MQALPHLRVLCPAPPTLVVASEGIAFAAFGPTIPWVRYCEWYAKNPEMLLVLVDEAERVLGYAELLPLHPVRAADFLAGRSGEADIPVDAILDADTVRRTRDLLILIPGMAVTGAGSVAGGRRGATLINAVRQKLDLLVARGHRVVVIANRGTDAGARLLRRFGATPVAEGAVRSDGMPLYSMKWPGSNHDAQSLLATERT